MKGLKQYIYEMLNAVDNDRIIKGVKSYIKEHYDYTDIEFKPRHKNKNKCAINISFKDSHIMNLINDDIKFSEYLNKMMWFITRVFNNIICIEPILANDITDYIHNKCGGSVFHITTKEKSQKILKTGFRLRIPNLRKNTEENLRIYVIYAEKWDKLYSNFKTIVYDKEYEDDEVAVLEIQLNKLKSKIPFYDDTFYYDTEARNCAFTLTNIPANIIKDVTNEFI